MKTRLSQEGLKLIKPIEQILLKASNLVFDVVDDAKVVLLHLCVVTLKWSESEFEESNSDF